MRISRIQLTDSLLQRAVHEELIALLLQVNQTITLKSGIQAFACPEGFATPLAPIVQKSLRATPCVMIHASKDFPWITIVKVVAPSTQDAVYFGNSYNKGLFVATFGLRSDFVFKYRYGLLGGHDVEILTIPAFQITVIPEGESKKIQALFLRHSDNSGLIPVYAKSKAFLQFLFQPSGYALTHKSSHYHKIIGKPHHSRSGEVVGTPFVFMECPVKLVQVDVCKEWRDYAALSKVIRYQK
jgi:hypothetical protein